MRATKSHVIPICSTCESQCQRDDQGDWFCVKCADDWLGRFIESKTQGKSVGGVELPAGISDERREGRQESFRDLIPNRRARRLMRGKGRR